MGMAGVFRELKNLRKNAKAEDVVQAVRAAVQHAETAITMCRKRWQEGPPSEWSKNRMEMDEWAETAIVLKQLLAHLERLFGVGVS